MFLLFTNRITMGIPIFTATIGKTERNAFLRNVLAYQLAQNVEKSTATFENKKPHVILFSF